MDRNASITDVIGLARRMGKYSSGTIDKGKITGDAYMSSRTPKLIRYLKSLYLTVREDKTKPKPNPMNPIIRMSNGKYRM
jgi:hypothetical protein